MRSLLLLFLYPGILGALADAEPSASAKSTKSILLSRVKSLTLRAGRMTTSRRVDPIPQLKCVGGDAQGLHEVDVMRCTNMDYSENPNDEEYEISWTCVANMPHFFKLGSTDVICEGYSSAEDPAVLKGSCGVEYRLMLTEAGHEKYRLEDTERSAKKKNKAKAKEKEKADEEAAAAKSGEGGSLPVKEFMLFLLLVLVFFGGIAVKALLTPAPPAGWNANGGGGGGGGGGPPGGGGGGGNGGSGGGGNNWRAGRDPPPAYDADYMVKSTRPTAARSASGASYGRRGGQPGFWTGAAAGAAAGAAGTYLATRGEGSGTRSSPSSVNGRRSSYVNPSSRRGWDDGAYSSNWGGAASSSSGSWDEMHDSTGFGQTRRR